MSLASFFGALGGAPITDQRQRDLQLFQQLMSPSIYPNHYFQASVLHGRAKGAECAYCGSAFDKAPTNCPNCGANEFK